MTKIAVVSNLSSWKLAMMWDASQFFRLAAAEASEKLHSSTILKASITEKKMTRLERLQELGAIEAAVTLISCAAEQGIKLQEKALEDLLASETISGGDRRLWLFVREYLQDALDFESVGLSSALVSFSQGSDAYLEIQRQYLLEDAPFQERKAWHMRLHRHFFVYAAFHATRYYHSPIPAQGVTAEAQRRSLGPRRAEAGAALLGYIDW